MAKIPKAERAYLDWIRGMACCWCGSRPPSVAHHHNIDPNPSGTAMKCSNYSLVPLCWRCHGHWHSDVKGLPVRGLPPGSDDPVIVDTIDRPSSQRFLERKVAQYLIKWMDQFDPEVF